MRSIGDRGSPRDVARARIAEDRLFVWEDGTLVSMAGWGGKTPNGVRVSFAYTPPTQRRRGYATSCVVELTRRLLAEGNRYCCLYNDLANPTSNAIYHRIGYRPLADAAVYHLVR